MTLEDGMNRLWQPLNVRRRLDHVVGRAALERFNTRLVRTGACHEDDRHPRVARLHCIEQLQSVIAQDSVSAQSVGPTFKVNQ